MNRTATPQTETPIVVPSAGAVASGTEVTITSGTNGAKIYYTLDGKTPTQSSTLYESPISITEAVTVKAKAYAPEHIASELAEAAFTIAE